MTPAFSWLGNLGLFALTLVACGNVPSPLDVSPSSTPPGLLPSDGRVMGTARLADEKCEAVYDDVAHAQGWFSGKASDRLKARMGEPDGTRKGGEVYWLAIDRAGNCNEYVADPDGRIGHGSLPARDCGLAPAAGPSASSPLDASAKPGRSPASSASARGHE